MHKTLAIPLLLLAAAAAQAEERRLTGPEIQTTLEEHVFAGTDANGKAWSQIFRKTGATFYTQDTSVSNGFWEVRGDQYCSQWPPNQAWSCYDVMGDGSAVVFVSATGARYPASRQN
jgi:hypothetical protein